MRHQNHNGEHHKLFRETWTLLYTNPRMFHYYVKHHDFTIHEKRLLKCLNLYKNNKKNECLELLVAAIPDDLYLEGIRFYIKGLVYNQHCHYNHAVENLEKAIALLVEIKEHSFLPNCYNLLLIIYGNRKEIDKVENVLDKLKEFQLTSSSQKLQQLYSETFYYVLINNPKAALATICKAEAADYPEFDGFKPYFLVQEFMLFSKNKDYDKCYKTLSEYGKLSGNMVKANYIYMKALLDHLTQNSPLYVYAKDFGDFPELYQQLRVIKNLKEGNLEEAKKDWAKLAKHNTYLYQENFQLKGDNTLFAQCLERYSSHLKEEKIVTAELSVLSSIMDKLHYILTRSSRPIEKEALLNMLWQEEYSEEGLGRLRTLISRYNRKYADKIVSYRGTYQIKKSA